MSVLITTSAGEIGEAVAPAMAEILDRSPGRQGSPTSPVAWSEFADAQWDLVGVTDDGGGATPRDLVEIAKTWGAKPLPLPYLETMLAKRHSPRALDSDGPVSFALPLASRPGTAVIPFAAFDRIRIATALGEDGDLVDAPAGSADELDLDSYGRLTSPITRFSEQASREVAITYAASALGAASELLESGIRYTRERTQFGKPIGSFQAVKHMLADALIDLERADTAVIRGSVLLDEAFRCARFATAQSLGVAEKVLQAHGAIGFTWEMNLHRPLRHIMAARDIAAGLASR